MYVKEIDITVRTTLKIWVMICYDMIICWIGPSDSHDNVLYFREPKIPMLGVKSATFRGIATAEKHLCTFVNKYLWTFVIHQSIAVVLECSYFCFCSHLCCRNIIKPWSIMQRSSGGRWQVVMQLLRQWSCCSLQQFCSMMLRYVE